MKQASPKATRRSDDSDPPSNGDGHAGGREKAEIRIPGSHCVEGVGTEDVGNDQFAGDVLESLPRTSIYRSSGVVGCMFGPAGGKSFRELNAMSASLLVDRHLRLVKIVRRRNGRIVREFNPCNRIHGQLLLEKAAVAEKVRELKRLIRHPAYVPGWTVSPRGWSPSGVFYDQPRIFDGLKPERCTETIRMVLEDLVVDFPFKENSDRESYFGLLLTPIVRPAIRGNIPGTLIHSSLERTGKSKLAELIGFVLSGEKTPSMQMTGSDDEVDKRILALLVKGETLVHMDNLGQFLDSRVLASLLTSSTYTGRWLGVSQMVTAPNNLTVVATGNNVQATGEIVKRMVPVRLQPLDGNPELRSNYIHPHIWVHAEKQRRLVVSCLIGMVANWIEAGMPSGKTSMGGFDEWAAAVGGIMHVNGFHQWLANLKDWRDVADERGMELLGFASLWAATFGDAMKTPMELAKLARENEMFLRCFAGKNEHGAAASFSKQVLTPNTDRPIKVNGLDCIIRRSAERKGNEYHLEGANAKCPVS